MPAIITVRAELTDVEVSRFPIEDGEPAANGEWTVIGTLRPGECREYLAHSRRAIYVRSIPAEAPPV